jgi:hypothetical protein
VLRRNVLSSTAFGGIFQSTFTNEGEPFKAGERQAPAFLPAAASALTFSGLPHF